MREKSLTTAPFAVCSIIVENRDQRYETAIKAGQYLVVAAGTSSEAAKDRNILSTLKPTHGTDHVLEPARQAVTR